MKIVDDSKIIFSELDMNDFEKLKSFLYDLNPLQARASIDINAERAKNGKIYAVYNGEKIIGSCWCLNLAILNYKVGGIGGVGVSEGYRKKKIGTGLIKYMLSFEKKKYDALLLWTRVSIFFKHFDFEDFTYGIMTNEDDSMPMILTENEELKIEAMNNKWPRIKF